MHGVICMSKSDHPIRLMKVLCTSSKNSNLLFAAVATFSCDILQSSHCTALRCLALQLDIYPAVTAIRHSLICAEQTDRQAIGAGW